MLQLPPLRCRQPSNASLLRALLTYSARFTTSVRSRPHTKCIGKRPSPLSPCGARFDRRRRRLAHRDADAASARARGRPRNQHPCAPLAGARRREARRKSEESADAETPKKRSPRGVPERTRYATWCTGTYRTADSGTRTEYVQHLLDLPIRAAYTL